jgi:hypothetical protein
MAELSGIELIQADEKLSEAAKTLAVTAAAIDDEAKAGVTTLMADKSLDAAGDDIVERIVAKLLADNPGSSEADVRSGVYSWWVF